MEWRLNKKQIAEVTAMFTELCEKIADADKEISLNLGVRSHYTESGEAIFTYDVYAIHKDKLIYIDMGSYRSLMHSTITNVDVAEIITLLKGDK